MMSRVWGGNAFAKRSGAMKAPVGLLSGSAVCLVSLVSSIGSATFAYQAERTLTAQAAGTVTSINVQEGSEVAKDDIILGLSGDDLTESIQSASESLRSAEISMQNLQDAMNNYTITAPISGTIIEKDAKVGDAVKAGDTLCIVYDLSYLEGGNS